MLKLHPSENKTSQLGLKRWCNVNTRQNEDKKSKKEGIGMTEVVWYVHGGVPGKPKSVYKGFTKDKQLASVSLTANKRTLRVLFPESFLHFSKIDLEV